MDFVLELLFASIAVVVIPVVFLVRFSPSARLLRSEQAVSPSYWGVYSDVAKNETSEFKAIPLLGPSKTGR